MKVLISHPTGNAFARSAAMGLHNADMLAGFRTTVATFPGNLFDRLSSFSPFAEFKRRQYDPALQPLTIASPVMELGRFAAGKVGLPSLTKHETGFFSVDAVYRNLDKQVASSLKKVLEPGDAVYAYEDGALLSFREAKQLQIKCLYDLPIGYWRSARKLLENEREIWPEWATTLIGFADSEKKLALKDEELRLADRIFVASTFTSNTLKDYPGNLAPIDIIPYAFPPAISSRDYTSFKGRPLKMLFVGGLSQRKGIANLFAAVNATSKLVQLTVVGRKASDDCPALDRELAKHNWIPSLPHNKILEIMREHDVLIFPSLFEGFGLVITEAMSQGTPVITTDRTAGPDLIDHDKNGWIIKAGSTEAIQKLIEELAAKPEKTVEAGKLALVRARQRSWNDYGMQLADSIKML